MNPLWFVPPAVPPSHLRVADLQSFQLSILHPHRVWRQESAAETDRPVREDTKNRHTERHLTQRVFILHKTVNLCQPEDKRSHKLSLRQMINVPVQRMISLSLHSADLTSEYLSRTLCPACWGTDCARSSSPRLWAPPSAETQCWAPRGEIY